MATHLTRRSLLLAAGVGFLTACAPVTARPGATRSTLAPTEPAPAPTTDAVRFRNVDALLHAASFVVAHRGSGDNWPEHTLTAYRASLAAGADAVEISVCATSDGVLVCHHDLSALRVTGVDRAIADMTWAEVAQLQVDARRWLGPATPLEPLSRLDDVLRELGPDMLAFIEDKQGSNTGAVLDLLDAQPRATERFVWKQWAGAGQVHTAVARGYRTWGYLDLGSVERVDEFAAVFDALGVPTSAPDDVVSRLVATGRPVMAWEVHLHDEVARLGALGVAGLMCANVPYIKTADRADADAFATGRRAAGDLPAGFAEAGWAAQPVLDPARAALRFEAATTASYLMGSLADPQRPPASVEVALRWPGVAPADGAAGFVVADTGDGDGADGRGIEGYQVEVSGDGSVVLRERAGGGAGAELARGAVTPPRPGEELALRVRLLAHDVVVETGAGTEVARAADERWRGPWVRLFAAYGVPSTVEFTSARVTRA